MRVRLKLGKRQKGETTWKHAEIRPKNGLSDLLRSMAQLGVFLIPTKNTLVASKCAALRFEDLGTGMEAGSDDD